VQTAQPIAGDPDQDAVEAIARRTCAAFGNDPSALLEVLHDVQHKHGDLPEAALRVIADALNLSRAEVYGVKSFYPDFRRTGPSSRTVHVCLGEACRSRGSGALFEALGRLGEAALTVAEVYCLGNCALSPSVMVAGVVHGRVLDADAMLRLVEGVEA
jgi:formate dehydrogenase subunit gamma